MKNLKSKLAMTSVVMLATASSMVSAIPTETTDAMTAQATEVATYTGPAVIFAVAVAVAGLAVKWTKRFISKAS